MFGKEEGVIKGKEAGKEAKIPRTWWSKAYLKEEDLGIYRLYRDILVEGRDSKSGQTFKEKFGKPIPVGAPLREAKKGEELSVKVRTFHPTENRLMELVEMD